MSKESIRQYVSEPELKFEIYCLKLSRMLNRIETLPKEQIIQDFNKEKKKKITALEKDKEKPKFQTPEAQYAITHNIQYLQKLEPPVNKKVILDVFQDQKHELIEHYKQLLQENNTQKIKEKLNGIQNT